MAIAPCAKYLLRRNMGDFTFSMHNNDSVFIDKLGIKRSKRNETKKELNSKHTMQLTNCMIHTYIDCYSNIIRDFLH